MNHQIIFFDGICHLCNGFVDTMIQLDAKKRRFKFAPLQGSTAQQTLPESLRVQLGSVVYYKNNQIYLKSDAVLRIFIDLGGPFILWRLGLIIPSLFRDFFYDWIAKNRYLWFGKREVCRLPLPEEKNYLLP